MLRLAFGRAVNPLAWCAVSEMITDLANEIALDERWDPRTLRNEDAPAPDDPKLEPDDVPLAQGRPLVVHIPTTVTAEADCFIDDIVNVFLDCPENREREPHKVPLAVYATAKPHAGEDEPIKRKQNLAANKLAAEGTPAKIQIVLGWGIDTRRLLVSLPFDKFRAWQTDLTTIIANRTTTEKELQSILGRLNHAAFIIPLARHFLGRLRRRSSSRTWGNHQITLSEGEILDLILWNDTLLPLSNKGVSMNLLTQRRPDNIGWSDTCPYGGGGFHQGGRAWRFRIPKSSPLYRVDMVNNFLEFLGMAVNTYLMVLDASEAHQCFLILGDNTSGLGWMM